MIGNEVSSLDEFGFAVFWGIGGPSFHNVFSPPNEWRRLGIWGSMLKNLVSYH